MGVMWLYSWGGGVSARGIDHVELENLDFRPAGLNLTDADLPCDVGYNMAVANSERIWQLDVINY
jgi:hypothetical protein